MLQSHKESSTPCPLPYPEKFKAAVQFVKDQEGQGTSFINTNSSVSPAQTTNKCEAVGQNQPEIKQNMTYLYLLQAEHAFKDENRLALYALEQQAVQGPCKDSKPWGWNVIESAKWQGWSQLGDMASVEAMRLFVRLLEDEKVCTLTALLQLLLPIAASRP